MGKIINLKLVKFNDSEIYCYLIISLALSILYVHTFLETYRSVPLMVSFRFSGHSSSWPQAQKSNIPHFRPRGLGHKVLDTKSIRNICHTPK